MCSSHTQTASICAVNSLFNSGEVIQNPTYLKKDPDEVAKKVQTKSG